MSIALRHINSIQRHWCMLTLFRSWTHCALQSLSGPVPFLKHIKSMQKPHVHRAASQLHTIYSNATSELERFAPQWTEQTHSDWSVLHELMWGEETRDMERYRQRKVETDVWGDSYSKISWDLFAGILFWLVVVHGEVFSTQPLW